MRSTLCYVGGGQEAPDNVISCDVQPNHHVSMKPHVSAWWRALPACSAAILHDVLPAAAVMEALAFSRVSRKAQPSSFGACASDSPLREIEKTVAVLILSQQFFHNVCLHIDWINAAFVIFQGCLFFHPENILGPPLVPCLLQAEWGRRCRPGEHMDVSLRRRGHGQGQPQQGGAPRRRGAGDWGADHVGQPRTVLFHGAGVLCGPREYLEVPVPLSEEWRRWAVEKLLLSVPASGLYVCHSFTRIYRETMKRWRL